MSKGIYTSLSGAMALERRVESIANNLANSKTVGFKKDDLTFKEHLSVLTDPSKDPPIPAMEFKPGQFYHLHGADKSFVTTDAKYTDYSQGPLRSTGRELDVALQGSGFFEVATPQGVRYSRNGVFSRSASGMLVNGEGFPVLSKVDAASAEAFTDPQARAIQLGRGKIHVAENGDIFVDGNFISSLQITEFQDATLLSKQGNNLYVNSDAANIRQDETQTAVIQRHVEDSNVNPVSEMVQLIEAQRLHDHNLKAIREYDAMAQKLATDVAKF